MFPRFYIHALLNISNNIDIFLLCSIHKEQPTTLNQVRKLNEILIINKHRNNAYQARD